MPVGGPRRGKLPQTKVNISLPNTLIERIEDVLRRDGTWGTSVADFIRQAAAEKIRELDGRERPALTETERKIVRGSKPP